MPRKSALEPATSSPSSLKVQFKKALDQGRLSEALAIAKGLAGRSSAREYQQELKEAYSANIDDRIKRQLIIEAQTLLEEAEKLSESDPAWWEKLALLNARAGNDAHARQLLQRAPESKALPRLLGFVVDRAMRDLQHGRDHLFQELQAGFDLIRQAFAQYGEGKLKEARDSLQDISIDSPYRDWKLLIRGLIAYSEKDDGRALENWSRLDPERLPAQLALPLRIQIDPALLASLTRAEAQTGKRRADQLLPAFILRLRELQLHLGARDGLNRALHLAPQIVQELRLHAPSSLQKLANCVYWALLQGSTAEIEQYARIFGPHPDDEHFCRLKALMFEQRRQFGAANEMWERYAAEIAASDTLPGEFNNRARATIWARMGDNASEALECGDDFDFLEDVRSTIRGGKPTAAPPRYLPEHCFRQAVALAPASKSANLALARRLTQLGEPESAEAVVRQYLERTPSDIDALVELSDLLLKRGEQREATETVKRAVAANPLDRELRTKLSQLNVISARTQLFNGDHAAARDAIEETIESEFGALGLIARALKVVLAYKDKDSAGAEKTAASFSSNPAERPAFAFALWVEGARAKLPKKVQVVQQAQADQALAGGLDMLQIHLLANVYGYYRKEPKPYRGINAHEKRISIALERVLTEAKDAAALAELGFVLLHNRFAKLLEVCVRLGSALDHRNPVFDYLLAEQMILQRPKTYSVRRVAILFHRVLSKIEDRHDDLGQKMREAIEAHRQEDVRLEEQMSPYFFFGPNFPF